MMAYIIAMVLIGLHANKGFAGPVCIIDSGIREIASIFDGRIIKKHDCTGEGIIDRHAGSHGTGTAGVVARYSDKNLLICKSLKGSQGLGYTSASVCCINWCAKSGANIVSMSFGGKRKSRIRERVINSYADKITFVASHGNRKGGPPSYPGQLENVISVAGVDKNGKLYKFNSGGKYGATGRGCLWTYDRRGKLVWRCGSSFAAPDYARRLD